LIYATTRLFLEIFGLKDLKDLPTPKEIEALEEAGGAEDINDSDALPVEDPLFSDNSDTPDTPQTPGESPLTSQTESVQSDNAPSPLENTLRDEAPKPQKDLDEETPSDYRENPDTGG